MTTKAVLRIPRDPGRLPPLTAFGMSLLLCLLCWVGLWELYRGVVWVVRWIAQ